MYIHTLISIHLRQMKRTTTPPPWKSEHGTVLFSEHFTTVLTKVSVGVSLEMLLPMFGLCVYHHNLERKITINSIYLLIYFIILLFDHTFDLRFGHKFRTFTFTVKETLRYKFKHATIQRLEINWLLLFLFTWISSEYIGTLLSTVDCQISSNDIDSGIR